MNSFSSSTIGYCPTIDSDFLCTIINRNNVTIVLCKTRELLRNLVLNTVEIKFDKSMFTENTTSITA